MEYQLPHTIQNSIGEKLVFLDIINEAGEEKLLVENFVRPGSGPLMHTHFLQDEALTVVRGRIGYQIKGQAARFAEPGETVVFKRGVPHKFWNAGVDELHCKGYVSPPNTIVFYLSAIYAAQNKTGTGKPDLFDGAFLLQRYASEYRLDEMPAFVRKVVIPIVYFTGKLLGKYKHFKNAPKPIK